VALQCLLAPWVAVLFDLVTKYTSRLHGVLGLGFAASLALAAPRAFIYPSVHTNHEQLAAVRQVEANLSPSDTYFDGLGMLPGRQLAGRHDDWWWDRPRLLEIVRELRENDTRRFQRIFSDQPKVWLLNYRTSFLMPLIGDRLAASYVRTSPLELTSGALVPEGQARATFICHWPGRYRLFSADGHELDQFVGVEGGSLGVEVELAYGPVTIHRSSSMGSAYLLPAGTTLDSPLPSQTEPYPDLFAEVYDF